MIYWRWRQGTTLPFTGPQALGLVTEPQVLATQGVQTVLHEPSALCTVVQTLTTPLQQLVTAHPQPQPDA